MTSFWLLAVSVYTETEFIHRLVLEYHLLDQLKSK